MAELVDLLNNSSYQDKPMYDGKLLFPYTGNIDADWLIFEQTLEIIFKMEQYSLDDYFYWLSFCKTVFLETHDLDLVEGILRSLVLNASDSFYLTTALGALVPGYGLIFPKSHVLSMSALDEIEKREYIEFLKVVRSSFFKAFKQMPMVFEHGSNVQDKPKSNSINHAHSHVVCYEFSHEQRIIKELEMRQLSSVEELLDVGQGNNYISYISPDDKVFYTDTCFHDSQLMRKFVARDIGLENYWNWRQYFFLENMFDTAKAMSLQRVRDFDKDSFR